MARKVTIKHRSAYQLLPESELEESILNDPLSRKNYLDKFHTLLYYEEHEHVRVLKERCDKELQVRKVVVNGEFCISLVGLNTNDVAYAQQAASDVKITLDGYTVHAEMDVNKKELDVIYVKCKRLNDYERFTSCPQTVPISFIVKHSYFKNLHISLARISSNTISKLIPTYLKSKKRKFPRIPCPATENLWLDQEHQLLALKKMMVCNNIAPFLLTGSFGTGKTRVLATAAINFLKRHGNHTRVLICTSHLHSADAYIDNYFGPMIDNNTLPSNVNPVRVRTDDYIYSGEYGDLFKTIHNHQNKYLIKHSRLIVTTFLTAPQLINLKMKNFTHILIDEGAQTREPEAIAPLGLAKNNTKIVIAGDHMQIGPQTLVLGEKALHNGLGKSLLQRLHEIYSSLPYSNPFKALLLTNYRCHETILRLPSNLFFNSTLQVRTSSQLHPKTSSALEFVFTSMDSGDNGKVVSCEDCCEKEARIVLKQVQYYVDPWPEAQWGEKDLSSICVMASSKSQIKLMRKFLGNQSFHNINGINLLPTYDIQGQEYRAIFISTLEATKEDGSTLNPTKSICDQYVFNTVITRAQSLIVCVGNPFLLFSIEKQTLNYKIYCWREYVKRCLEISTFQLFPECHNIGKEALQQAITKLYEETFGDLQESLDSPCGNVQKVSDSILAAYKRTFQSNRACQDVKLILGNVGNNNGDCSYLLQRGSKLRTANKPQVLDSSTVGNPMECYLESITFRKVVATPLDPSQPAITINGVDNRRGALDGALVKVALYESGDRCGKVTEVVEQGPQQQFVCSVDSHNSTFFCPIDQKSPKLANLPRLSREMLEQVSNDLIIEQELNDKQHAVTVFDPKSFINPSKEANNGSIKFANIEVPQIKDVIPLSIAQKLLFVVSFLRWNPKYPYPLGVVVGAIPRGLTLYHARRMLLAHHHINTSPVDMASDDDDISEVNTYDSTLPHVQYYDHAMTIDPLEAETLDDALTLEPKDDGHAYHLGVHIANVGKYLNSTAEVDKNARKRGTAVYGSKSIQLFYPMLPKKIRDILSLDCNKNASTISITCKVSIVDENIEIDEINVQESLVCSRARLTYKDAQELLSGVKKSKKLGKIVKDYNETLPADDGTFGLEKRLAILFQISEHLLRCRTKIDDVNYTIEDEDDLSSPQAHFLVKEMMIWANRIVAEHVLAAFPNLTLLRRQKSPNQDQLTKTIEQYEDAVDFSPLYKSLAAKLNINITPGPFVMMELFRNQLLRALQFGDIKQASDLLRVTGYHPQLAVLNKEVNRSKSRAQYVCSGDLQEQVKLDLQHGDYLVSLTDPQKEVYGHYDLCCLYTHFTSPLRRYIDIVMQRLILQSLSSPGSNDLYTEDELKSICTECNVNALNANSFQREFNRLTLALSLAECSQPCTAYVASIEKSLQLVIRELDCQFLSPNQRRFRLSSITNGTKPCAAELMNSKSFLWKSKITSFTSKYLMEGLNGTRKCLSSAELTQDVLLTFYSPEAGSDSTVPSALAQQCYSAEFSNKPLTLSVEECTTVANFMKQPLEDTATPLKELLMSHNSTENDNGVKFPTNASFWLYEVKQSFEAYKCFKISLAANFNDYILSPCIQLLEVAPMLNVCVQHSTNPASCFSTPILSQASRTQYNDIDEYIDLWEKVLLAEGAVQSISDDAEVQLIQNVVLKWPKLAQPINSLDDIHYLPITKSSSSEKEDVTLTISDKFEERCGEYFDFEVGNLVCARYNIPLKRSKTVEGRDVETASAVYHFVIDTIETPEKPEKLEKKSRKRRSKKPKVQSEVQSNKIVHLKIISKEAARVSEFMKPYLENPNSSCEIQIIPLDIPYRRMYKSLLALNRVIRNNELCQRIALGRDINLSAEYTVDKIFEDQPVLALWSNDQLKLNPEQKKSLCNAIKNKFQLIQGPPGTGKSVTGAHLAYAFIVANNPDLTFVPSLSDDEKIKCVMYCGPSNKSVDVVLKMFLNHPNIKDLRILRIYSKSIESKYHSGPHSCKVYSKPRSDQECEKEYEQFALHVKIRSNDCSLSDKISAMEKKFERYGKENKLPSPAEKKYYKDVIKRAQEKIIHEGHYHIVFCTCNEACSARVVENIEPMQLIIDEAAMATEPEAMIPIKSASHVTLIGDHMQLQPVINYRPAKENGLGCSLFQRYAEMLDSEDPDLMIREDSMLMLKMQYRMHKMICEFPSNEFYHGDLEAAPSVLQHFCALEGFWPSGPQCPIAFCDIVGKEEGASSHHKAHQESKCNEAEANKIVDIIIAMYKCIEKEEPKIAVLTPYRAQKRCVEELVKEEKLEVTVSTINESQGSEFDFVIFSTVRSLPCHIISNRAAVQPDRAWIREHLGFITDRHQICVGITRAKHGLVIVGNAMLLSYDKTWQRLIEHYENHHCKVEESAFPSQQ